MARRFHKGLFMSATAMMLAAFGFGASLQIANRPIVLTVTEISPWTIRIALHPMESGKTQSVTAEPILAPREWPRPQHELSELAGSRSLTLKSHTLTIGADPLTVEINRSDGKTVQRLTIDSLTAAVEFIMGDGPVLGLGGGGRGFDRRGTFDDMNKGHRSGEYQIFGSRVPVPFLVGTRGWALFVHRPYNAAVDLRKEPGRIIPKREPEIPKEEALPLDLFVISLDTPARAASEYAAITGMPAMPPKWALGYQQSHRTLSGPREVLEDADTFRRKQLPCDVLIYLGTGYCPAGWNTGHGSLEFNPATFRRPQEILDRLHEMNFKIVLHKNRAPVTLHGDYPENVGPEEGEDHVVNYWNRHLPALALGVDGWWPDDGDNLPIDSRLTRHMIYFKGSLSARPDVRPWSLHRTGYAGMQRYGGWVWSGDVFSLWDTLAAHVPVGINFSLSASPFWGTDIGGFSPTKELTGELYVRWFQFAAFNPLFRSHGRMWYLRRPWGWNTGDLGPDEVVRGHAGTAAPDPSVVHNPAVEPICKQYMELRYRLMPYTYTITREACDTGMPLMRALWLHYPDEPQAVACGDAYLWGRDILVAPVTEPGATRRSVYLPSDIWYDFWSNRRFAGGETVIRYVDLATMPLFVRAGAIIPLGPVIQYVDQPTDEPVELSVYSGADGSFVLYEDDGVSLSYADGKAAWTRFTWSDEDRALTIEPDPGSDPGKIRPRSFRVRIIPGRETREVKYPGQKQVYHF